MSLLTLQNLSIAFGHLPLLDGADLRIESGERICLIGRNGTGKSTLLRVISGEVEPDRGSIWRAPGLRVARLEQDVPGEGDRTVFDEVADGLGELGTLVTAITGRRWPPTRVPRHSSGSAGSSTSSRSATAGGWNRRWSSSCLASICLPTVA